MSVSSSNTRHYVKGNIWLAGGGSFWKSVKVLSNNVIEALGSGRVQIVGQALNNWLSLGRLSS